MLSQIVLYLLLMISLFSTYEKQITPTLTAKSIFKKYGISVKLIFFFKYNQISSGNLLYSYTTVSSILPALSKKIPVVHTPPTNAVDAGVHIRVLCTCFDQHFVSYYPNEQKNPAESKKDLKKRENSQNSKIKQKQMP